MKRTSQGLKTTSTVIMVEKTWSEDEINNQNGMTLYKSGPTPHQYLLNLCRFTLRVLLEASPNFYKRNNCAQSLWLPFQNILSNFIPQLPTNLPYGETNPWPLWGALPRNELPRTPLCYYVSPKSQTWTSVPKTSWANLGSKCRE